MLIELAVFRREDGQFGITLKPNGVDKIRAWVMSRETFIDSIIQLTRKTGDLVPLYGTDRGYGLFSVYEGSRTNFLKWTKIVKGYEIN